MAKFEIKILKDILKEKTKDGKMSYSQGRVYLFVSFVLYFISLGIIGFKSFTPDSDVDIEIVKILIEALQYAMVLFGGYVFGGKFIDVIKVISGKKEK